MVISLLEYKVLEVRNLSCVLTPKVPSTLLCRGLFQQMFHSIGVSLGVLGTNMGESALG